MLERSLRRGVLTLQRLSDQDIHYDPQFFPPTALARLLSDEVITKPDRLSESLVEPAEDLRGQRSASLRIASGHAVADGRSR